ncbi:MAG: YifB family Mg chelatase-like AAA ATPase [Deltaproteobacteria bacterium]|nr:YifB family Mg chelatase-like AAA ATPase [Deltaproteobacteria bacterium]
MLARAATGTIIGVDAHEIIVEAHRANGLPCMTVIGLARGAVCEAAVRVRSAITASDIHIGSHRLVVNLLPAELEKDASAIDLALAMSLLAALEIIPASALAGRRFFGELSLGGALEPVRGAVLIADLAHRMGDKEIFVPASNATEAAVIDGISVLGAHCLQDVIDHICNQNHIPATNTTVSNNLNITYENCLSEVKGQKQAKRALIIAAAGNHNLLLIGPPGSGKTMLARRLPALLPPLTNPERIEVTRIHSAAGKLASGNYLICERPFRSPHHTASDAALCGGGSVPKPGEVTLAHRGVLFLDELPEFSRRALESLREPLEEGAIHISRAARSLVFPARVLLIAAMNPCPCGRFQINPPSSPNNNSPLSHSNQNVCVCSFDQIQRYRARISGPLLDRIDLHVNVDAVPYRDFSKRVSGESSRDLRSRIITARSIQEKRLGSGRTNSTMTERELNDFVPLNNKALAVLERAVDINGLSSRTAVRMIKVARTIADLEQREHIEACDLSEALNLRLIDRNIELDIS